MQKTEFGNFFVYIFAYAHLWKIFFADFFIGFSDSYRPKDSENIKQTAQKNQQQLLEHFVWKSKQTP